MKALVHALFKLISTEQVLKIKELEPLVLRYREAAKEASEKEGELCIDELDSHMDCARLHEVLCFSASKIPSHCSALASTNATSLNGAPFPP